MTRPLRTHVFADSGQTDWRGEPICSTCDDVKSRPAHDVPELSQEARDLKSRMLGEPA